MMAAAIAMTLFLSIFGLSSLLNANEAAKEDRYKVVWASGVIGIIELAAAVAVWFIVP